MRLLHVPSNRHYFGRLGLAARILLAAKTTGFTCQTTFSGPNLNSAKHVHKLSGLSANELQLAYNSLVKLKKSIVGERPEEEGLYKPAPKSSEQQLDAILSLLKSRLEGPQSLSFLHMTKENLAGLNITFIGLMELKPDFEECIAETTFLGQDKLWSSANLYHQLHLLEGLIPRMTEASTHAWIDAFFFRASAMLPLDESMVINIEQVVPSTTVSPSSLATLSGIVDYTAIVAKECVAAGIWKTPFLEVLKKHTPPSFFVIEAKLSNLWDYVPQAVSELYACGRLVEKKVIRGALTNGHDWVFLLIKLNDNYDGASYWQSELVGLRITRRNDGKLVIIQPWPDLIAAILSHWIKNSFVDLGSDDWFQPM